MSLNGGTLTVSTAGAVTQTAATTLQAATSLVKQGTGTMTLSQANTYTGTTNVQVGTLTVTNASGLGTVAGGTTVAAGATLNINNVAVGAEALTLNGTLQGTGAGASLAGAVALGAGTAPQHRGCRRHAYPQRDRQRRQCADQERRRAR